MGIKGLLPELKNCTEHYHISTFRGKKIAIDGFVWLHKASYFCAKELFYLPGTKKILPYLVSKLRILLDNDIQPFFVFDGRSLPIKGNVNDFRRQIREQAINKINKLQQEGKADQITSTDYSTAVSIKHETVQTFISFLKKNKISFIVAPYEADAQLAYLARSKYVDLVLTEDSDLLAYGVPQVLFKMNFKGFVDSIKIKDAISLLHFNSPNNESKREFNQSKRKSNLIPDSADFSTFTHIEEISESDYDDFLTFCILTGCDYAPHIKSVGPKTALSLVQEYHSSIDLILNQLSQKKKVVIPPNYKQAFLKAKKTFMHQKVYNIDLKAVVPLAPLLTRKNDSFCLEDFDYLFTGKTIKGKKLSQHIKGEIDSHHHIITHEEDAEIEEEEEENQEEDFDDSDMNEFFLPFTRSYNFRAKSAFVIPNYKFTPNKPYTQFKENAQKDDTNTKEIEDNNNNNNNNNHNIDNADNNNNNNNTDNNNDNNTDNHIYETSDSDADEINNNDKQISFLANRSAPNGNDPSREADLENPFQQAPRTPNRGKKNLRRCMSLNSKFFNLQPAAPSYMNPMFFNLD